MGHGFEALDNHDSYMAPCNTAGFMTVVSIEMKFGGGEGLRAHASVDEILFGMGTHVARRLFEQKRMRECK